MSVKIGHASIDENGKIAGGVAGDQTGREICIRDWYNKPWNVYLECTDPAIANIAAKYMEEICSDPNYGYDQGQRTTGYTSIVNNDNKVKGGKGEFDCSSLIATCYKLAGLDISVNNTTRTLKKALLSTGKFIVYDNMSHLSTGENSKRGGVYLSEGHHVVMVLQNGTTKKENPYQIPKDVVEFGELGIGVRWVQWELNQAGYTVKIDGEFGSKTDKAVKEYQKAHGLTVDGKVGPLTRKSMINN